jgi:hypothetical protein
MSTKKGIGHSPLTDKVYLGRQNKEKGMWIGEKEDITNDFINILFAYVPENTSRIIETGEDKNIFLNVKDDVESIEKAINLLSRRIK